MKFLVVFACALAAASAGFVAPLATVYSQPQHLPVIGANGVPVETAEVQHAKAAHFVHKAETHARNGDFVAPVVSTYAAHTPVVSSYVAPVVAHAPVVSHAPAAYPTTLGHPGNVNGVPLETPEVVAAKSNHFAAHAEALTRNGDLVTKVVAPVVSTYAAHSPVVAHAPLVSAYSAPFHGVVAQAGAAYPTTLIHPGTVNGVPLETPEVFAAKGKHFAAHAEALVRNGDAAILYRHRRGIYTPLAYSTYNYGAFPYSYSAPFVHHY